MNINKHLRRSIRLPGFDYSSARAYFVSLCTRERACLLNDAVVKGIIDNVWHTLPEWFPTISLDEFVIMPNHIHFIVWLGSPNTPDAPTLDVGATLAVALDASRPGAGASPAPTDPRPWKTPECVKTNDHPTLGDVVGAFKSLIFKVYLDWIKTNDPSRRAKFWQRNYYEHIVRNERELQRIRFYIQENPMTWEKDRDNLKNTPNLLPPSRIEDYLNDIGIIESQPDEKDFV